jgi:HEAT repeat protein
MATANLSLAFLHPAPGAWSLYAVESVKLDQTRSALFILALLALVALVGALFYQIGFLGWVLKGVGFLVRGGIRQGFLLWERLFAWAHWPIFLAIVVVLLVLGEAVIWFAPDLSLLFALALLLGGVTTCLAYMFIDLERYEVKRGYKAIHNPLKGQEPALYLPRYGQQVGIPLLAAASVASIVGFALLEQALYETVGRQWYKGGDEASTPGFVDFLAYAFINLLGIVDILNVARTHHYLETAYVRPAAWPASLLLACFRSFFTLVLLQQIFASLRHGRLLAETIADFWSPHEPIHERARSALPEYGTGIITPLLGSLRTIPALTSEQREQLPLVLAGVGPGAIPALVGHLDDPHEGVRAMCAATLAHLGAIDTVPLLAPLVRDSSEAVRQSLVDGLGILGAAGASLAQKKHQQDLARRRRMTQFRWPFWKKPPVVPPMSGDPIELIVATLATALTDDSVAVRARATGALARVGASAAAVTPALIGLLKDPDETVRCRAAEALGQVGGEEEATVPALMELLEEPSTAIKEAAAKALAALKQKAEPAVESLIRLLHDREESVRTAAAEAIAAMGRLNGTATDTLTEALVSADTLVRARTAEALGTIGPTAQEVAPALVEAMADSNDRVRAKAVQALGRMGESAAVAAPSLVRALHDPDHWVSALAAEALGEIGESAERAIPALVRALGHSNALVRGNAAEALGKMGPAAAETRPALENLAHDPDGGVRAQAIRALGLIGPSGPHGREAVLEALEDADPLVRAAAVETIGQWGEDGEMAERLMPLLEDANDQVKVQVAGVLPKLAGPTAAVIDGLCKRLLEDDSPEVRVHAALALGKLGPAAVLAGPVLLEAAQTAEAPVREQAMRAIAIIQPPETAAAFAAGLQDASAEIRKVASGGWMNAPTIPDEVIPALVQALRDPESQVRANAAHALSRLPALPDGALPLLIDCTGQANDGLRMNAVMALRLAPPEAVVEVMQHLLDDPTLRVRLIAAGTLLATESDNGRARAVVTEGITGPSAAVRRAALELVESLPSGPAAFAEVLQQRGPAEEAHHVREVLDRLLEGEAKVLG